MTKYWRTVMQIEILSEGEEAPSAGDLASLSIVDYQIRDGEWSGDVRFKQFEIKPAKMAQLLIAQGSDPEFLGLKADGSPAEEE